VTESLATTFPGVPSFSVFSLQSADFTVNPNFDGAGDTPLLAAGNTLPVGGGGTILLTVRVDSGGNAGPCTNQVTTQGTSPAGAPVTDVSQDGADPDPDGNGEPGDNGDLTPILLIINVLEIPTLGSWGLLALMALLPLVALRRLRPGRG
jgi:hypothetical protein